MAKKSEKPELAELIRRSEAARLSLSRSGARFKHKLSFAGRATDVVKSDPTKAIGGSIVAGFLLKKLLTRKKKSSPKASKLETKVLHLKKERGLLLSLLALIGMAARPAAKMYATKLIKDYLQRRLHSGLAARRRATPLRQY